MKAFTSLEQSKKLAEILPLESADMYFEKGIGDNYKETFGNYADMHIAENMLGIKTIPCWSFAALLNAVDFSTINLHYDNVRTDWVASATIRDSTKHCTKYESTRALNPVDACYEMIIKLNELKML